MPEYKNGDRVRLLENDLFDDESEPEVGALGTVTEAASSIIRVHWDGNDYSRWNMYSNEIELVEEAVDPIQDAKDLAYAAGYKAGLEQGIEDGYALGIEEAKNAAKLAFALVNGGL